MLHTGEDGNDCGNEWCGSPTMCDVTDAIYLAIDALIANPTKFVDQNFIMSIFDRWLKKTVPATASAFITSPPTTTTNDLQTTPAAGVTTQGTKTSTSGAANTSGNTNETAANAQIEDPNNVPPFVAWWKNNHVMGGRKTWNLRKGSKD